jgi:Fe-S oxidoreductase
MAENPAAEILFWVGCAGAYDARYQKVAQAFVKILKHAGVNFAILGTEEKCTGDAARRMGNEYLAQMLMNENIATLNNYHIKKIVAICPHCFHSLKREYPAFGGNYEVIHHSDFIFNLVQSGKIRLSKNSASTVTYHDSCYLARYHDLIDSPRSVMASIPGLQLIEMNRSKDRGLCCGAGGGRMWMEETAGKRINIERTEEAMNTHAGTIGTACPFCLTMLSDGIKAKDAAESVQIRDIAELVWDAMEKSS